MGVRPEQLKLFEAPEGRVFDLTFFRPPPLLEIGKQYDPTPDYQNGFQVVAQIRPGTYRCVAWG